MNLRRIALVARYLGVPKESRDVHIDDGQFTGITFTGLTYETAEELVGSIVDMEPLAADAITVETPGVVMADDKTVTVRYGDVAG